MIFPLLSMELPNQLPWEIVAADTKILLAPPIIQIASP
jgi:hypothetical protein